MPIGCFKGEKIMFCPHCGKELDDRAVICPHCGIPIKDLELQQPKEKKLNGFSLLGFIMSFFFWVTYIGSLASLLGLIFSCIGVSQCNKEPNLYKGKGFGVAGIIISILPLIFYVLMIILLILGISSIVAPFIG